MQVPGLYDVITVTAGRHHCLALTLDGTVWAWGYNYYGQLGEGTCTDRYMPVRIPDVGGVTAVAAGAYHSVFLRVWPGDLSGDGDVDAEDVTLFRGCMTGPGVAAQLSAACQPADLDHDLDVDMSDFGILQRCYSGPEVLADPACAN